MNQADFDLFFENPDVRRDGPGEFGILYLLRRDINRCLVLGEGSWLGAMGVMAGVDLLGKFLEGNDDTGKVGKRFRHFLRQYFPLGDASDAETLYQLRNSMLHSFGLYSPTENREYRSGDTTPNSPTIPFDPGCRDTHRSHVGSSSVSSAAPMTIGRSLRVVL